MKGLSILRILYTPKGKSRGNINSPLTTSVSTIPPESLLRNYFVECSWPNIYYARLQAILEIVRPVSFVEVGVAYGYHAIDLLKNNPQLQYVGVDPYIADYDPKDGFSKDVEKLFNLSGQIAMDTLFETVLNNLQSDFPGRSKLFRSSSENIIGNFEDASVDMIFIDGDHRYEPVLKDLRLWLPKIKSRGVISGDDWNWKEVSDAVLFFTSQNELQITLLTEPGSDHTLFMMVKP